MIFIHKNCQHLFEFYLKKSFYIYDFLNNECNLEFYQYILHIGMHKFRYFYMIYNLTFWIFEGFKLELIFLLYNKFILILKIIYK